MPQELRKRHRSHARPLKNLDERFEWYADGVELEPAGCKGTWAARHCPAAREVHLDLGCGKGQFSLAQAKEHPDQLFIGLDYEKICIALAAEKAVESKLDNVIFTLADAEDLGDLFGPGELDAIHLNFSTPHPRKKHAAERLTYVDNLIMYRPLLKDGGTIHMKTDSAPFFEFSLVQFDLAGYDVVWTSADLRTDRPELATTEYEDRLTEKGAKIHALRAVKANRPYTREQTAALSLFDYLPDDLEHMDYIPYGMERGVMNMRNVRAKQRAKLQGK